MIDSNTMTLPLRPIAPSNMLLTLLSCVIGQTKRYLPGPLWLGQDTERLLTSCKKRLQSVAIFHRKHRIENVRLELELEKVKKVTHSGSKTPIYVELYRDFPQRLCTWSFYECRRHYSSWEVSRESQSSPLRFFVESIATDHQEVSYFFSEKKTVLWRIRTRDLEPRVVSPDHPATVTYLFYCYYLRYLKLP